MMTGNYSTIDQAAVATGNMLFWPVFRIGWEPFYSHSLCGSILRSQKHDQIGPSETSILAWYTSDHFSISILSLCRQLIKFFKTPMEVQKITKNYLLGLMVGTPALFLFQPLKSSVKALQDCCQLQ